MLFTPKKKTFNKRVGESDNASRNKKKKLMNVVKKNTQFMYRERKHSMDYDKILILKNCIQVTE